MKIGENSLDPLADPAVPPAILVDQALYRLFPDWVSL